MIDLYLFLVLKIDYIDNNDDGFCLWLYLVIDVNSVDVSVIFGLCLNKYMVMFIIDIMVIFLKCLFLLFCLCYGFERIKIFLDVF